LKKTLVEYCCLCAFDRLRVWTRMRS